MQNSDLRRSRLWQDVSRCRAVGYQLPSTLNSCGRVDDVQFFYACMRRGAVTPFIFLASFSTTAIYGGVGTTDIQFEQSLSASQFIQLRPHGKSSQNNDQHDVQLHDDIAFVAGIIGASVRGAIYTQCTASPCTARSRPSRSTSSLIRSPIMASSAPRMISDTMAS